MKSRRKLDPHHYTAKAERTKLIKKNIFKLKKAIASLSKDIPREQRCSVSKKVERKTS